VHGHHRDAYVQALDMIEAARRLMDEPTEATERQERLASEAMLSCDRAISALAQLVHDEPGVGAA
jgi:hypothetical protein